MTVVLVLLAIFAALFGAANLSPATLGVGVICLACLLGILARIAQAYEQHRQWADHFARERQSNPAAVFPAESH